MAHEALLRFQHEHPEVGRWASDQLEAESHLLVRFTAREWSVAIEGLRSDAAS